MIPILVPIVSMLAEKGLGLLSKALDVGEQKVITLVEEKTGVKLNEVKSVETLPKEDLDKLTEFQANFELELSRIALSNKIEDNRHVESLVTASISDTANAREKRKINNLKRRH
jgi:hypothetical protein